VLGGLDCTILPSNSLTPTLSKMRKDARMQAVLRDQRLLGWGVSPQHDAVFYDFIRQSNNSWTNPHRAGEAGRGGGSRQWHR
jgi:hypothetical protein